MKYWYLIIIIVFFVGLKVYQKLHLKNKNGNLVVDMDGKKYKIYGQPFIFDTVTFPFVFGRFWESFLQPHFKRLVAENPNGIILDIGANIGGHTVFMANQRPVWAFEPQHKTFTIAHKNIVANTSKYPIQLYPFGSSDTNNKNAELNPPTIGNIGRTSVGSGGEVIELKTLDSLWISKNKPRICFIKIDVEGHEVKVFEGAKQLLETENPPIIFEDHTGENSTYLKKLGYKIKNIKGHDMYAVRLKSQL